MKKTIKFLIGVALTLSLLAGIPQPVLAEDPGYYYQSIDVQVLVNEKREYQITETLHVYFEEEMHGIIRNIPDESSAEGYLIRDIEVEGAPYVVEDTYNGIDVRIGDAQKTIQGEMTVVLRYTLKHYQDYDESADYIYLNLIGSDFDCRTEKLTASITYPEAAVFEKCTVTEGEYGNLENEKIEVWQEANTLYFESNRSIQPYEGVTVQIRLAPSAFPEAPEYVFPYVIKEKNITVEINEEQDFQVHQTVVLEANENYVYYPLDLQMDAFDYDERVEVRDFQGTLDGRQITSEYSVSIDHPGEHVIDLHYVIHPFSILQGDLDFRLQDSYEDTQVQKLTFAVTLPKVRTYGVTFNRYNDALDSSRYQIKESSNTLLFESRSVLQPAEEAVVTVYVSAEDYYRPLPLSMILIPSGAGLLLLLVIYLKFFRYRNAELIAPITFYPPQGINSAEAGYLIDQHLSDEDMTSLIFGWAAQSALRIEDIQGHYTLVKTDDLPESCPAYEKKLFRQMFEYGEAGRVSKDDLEGVFWQDIARAKIAIQNKYKREIPIYEKVVQRVSWLCTLAAVGFPVAMLIALQALDGGFGLGIGTFMMTPILMALVCFFISIKVREQIGKGLIQGIVLLMAMIPLLVFLLISMTFVKEYRFSFFTTLGVCAVTIVLAQTMRKRTKQGNFLLGQLTGFKQFLKTAEKDQLEMLLEENPEYYYAILPYAQALHVTKIWEEKFEGIAMQPPTWYISSSDVFVMSSFYRFTHDLSREMTAGAARPVSHSSGHSGGGFSGGGGGFSGGGFSGGGSGGGGSRGW